ncbi:hypothetical protein KYT87_18010 [Achromobacter sp. ES-001]|uniref:T6SS effector BTH_I2691 family protein n=1 Tax=Achromobacter sp. ES-001 TaxID=2860286 RepID=UPI001C641BD8|nr:T6SS effector BTH_I2691 family protein [Achromobacter sp. ES-001]QYJ19606.1 hypothetical protein KYT87_18010 [Achromobacter sp. ES-001]
MTTSSQLAIAAQETSPLPLGSCPACRRTGIPILLLRPAVIPKAASLHRHGATTHPDLQQSLRILRSGYVYVLLDHEVWQAYEVTDAGHLRQFDPYEMAKGPPALLSERCVQSAHDLPASFIGIDVDMYTTAWVAYAQDPWPVAVLDAYKAGAGAAKAAGSSQPAAGASHGTARAAHAVAGAQQATANSDHALRFVILDLSKLRKEPTAGGAALALEHAHRIDRHIAEYSHAVRDFGSVHGWHSRVLQATGMRNYLRLMELQHDLAKGVPGLILPDPVGLAQELNNFRLAAYTQKRMWAEEPQRRYAYLTSQCLLGIEQLYAAQADAEIPDSPTYMLDTMPSESGMAPIFRDPALERRERIAYKTEQRMDRLKERYWESDPPSELGRKGRASFQASYDKESKRLEAIIDAYGEDWAQVVRGAAWKRVVDLDYSDTDERSRRLRLLMVSACLDGGITDAVSVPLAVAGSGVSSAAASSAATANPPTAGHTGGAADPARTDNPGPTSQAWKQLLSDPHSAVYLALNGQRSDLQSSFLPLFSAGAGGGANDAAKKYFDAVKNLVSSKEIGAWREGLAADAADQLLAAVHGASSRLHAQLNDATRAAVNAVHVGGAWLYRGAQMTQVVIQLTVSELLAIYADELQRVGESLNQNTGRRVRAFIFAGLISIPDPALHKLLVDVTIWMEGSAEDIAQRIKTMRTGAADVSDAARDAAHSMQAAIDDVTHSTRAMAGGLMRRLSIGVHHLEAPVADLLIGLELTAEQAREFAKNGFVSLKRLSVGSGYGALSLVSLYFLHDSVQASLESARNAVGAEHAEAMAALYGAGIGMLGAGVEAGGLAVSVAGEAVQPFMRRIADAELGVVAKAIGLGKGLVKAGGAIAALGGVADGVGAFAAGGRAAAVRDGKARTTYTFAGLASFGGAFFSLIGAATKPVLMGPLGIGIAVGLLAFILSQSAKARESDALELWARRSYFGQAEPNFRWLTADQMDAAISELNAALIGMEAILGFRSVVRPMDVDSLLAADILQTQASGGMESRSELGYRIVLPGFDPEVSRYEFKLLVECFGIDKVGRHAPAAMEGVLEAVHHNSALSAPALDEFRWLTPKGHVLPTKEAPVLACKYWLEPLHGIKSATVSIAYWCDKDDVAGYASITMTEVA